MDVYGAFQLCAIGILTAPVTVRLSNTYFNNPGRNIIFLWTGLLLAGLLSLTVEFIRLDATTCPPDDPASIEWAANKTFGYTSTCGMICGAGGPYSPLRQGAADNINVIPVPQMLTFNTTTLLAAACCIPAILSLVSMWIKILEENWKKISDTDEKHDEQPIEGTNGATPKQMTGIADKVRGWLTLIEIPVFVAAVLAILIRGEMNFWSRPVMHQTEPIKSIGNYPFVYCLNSWLSLLQGDKKLTETHNYRSMGTACRHWTCCDRVAVSSTRNRYGARGETKPGTSPQSTKWNSYRTVSSLCWMQSHHLE